MAIPDPGSCTTFVTRCLAVLTSSNLPENSQLTRKRRPSAVKSAWFTPAQGTGTLLRTCMVWASRKTSSWRAEAMTTA